MKVIEIILAYIGVTLMVAATAFSAKLAWVYVSAPKVVWTNPPWENWIPYQYFLLAMAVGIPGALLASFGILVAGRHMWISLLSVGSLYCLATLTWLVYPGLMGKNQFDSIGAILVALGFLLPGIVCVLEGIGKRGLD